MNDAEAGHQVAALLDGVFTPGRDACFSSHDGSGGFRGGVILTGYTGEIMEVQAAASHRRWLCRDLLWITCHYPLVQLGCSSLIARVASGNAHCQEILRALGFVYITSIPEALPGGEDIEIHRLWRSSCRWLGLTPSRFTPGG